MVEDHFPRSVLQLPCIFHLILTCGLLSSAIESQIRRGEGILPIPIFCGYLTDHWIRTARRANIQVSSYNNVGRPSRSAPSLSCMGTNPWLVYKTKQFFCGIIQVKCDRCRINLIILDARCSYKINIGLSKEIEDDARKSYNALA